MVSLVRHLAASLLLIVVSACSGADILNALAVRPAGIEFDVSYGELPRQTLDRYRTRDGDGPVLIYFHGGGWKAGSKNDYKFLGTAFAATGIEVLIPNYRLYPDVIYPQIVEDPALAIQYAGDTVAKDRPLFVMGHSAGAHLAAQAIANHDFLQADCGDITGFIGLAGPYDFDLSDPDHKATFPEAVREDAKPVNHADGFFPPALLLHGLADTTVPILRSEQFVEALNRAGHDVELKPYEGVDHIDILGAIAPLIRARAPTFDDVAEFIEKNTEADVGSC